MSQEEEGEQFDEVLRAGGEDGEERVEDDGYGSEVDGNPPTNGELQRFEDSTSFFGDIFVQNEIRSAAAVAEIAQIATSRVCCIKES